MVTIDAMKRATLEAVLRRKVRLKITSRKRGGEFEVCFPARMTHDGQPFVKRCGSKREALVWLLVQLRCLEEIVIEVRRARAATGRPSSLPQGNSSRTLLLPAPGRVGVLVEGGKGRMREQPMPFADAHAALTWCQAQGVTLVYCPTAAEPAQN